MPPRVIFRLLGPWEVHVESRLLPKPSTLKAQSLLAYLLISGGGGQPREKLAGLFWPDADEDRAQRSLRTALWSLRKLLEEGHPGLEEALIASRFDVRWAPPFPVEVDTQLFETASQFAVAPAGKDRHAALVALETASTLYRGPLLEGFYDDWCLNERYRLEERFLQVLEALVGAYEASGRLREAVASVQRLLEVDPLREEMHCAAIRMLGMLGDRPGVARQYARCKQVLQDELDMAPSAETEAIYAEARSAPIVRLRPAPATSPSAVASAPSAPLRPTGSTLVLPSHNDAPRVPLIGRQTQWDALAGWLAAAESGQGHVALIAGEAGCGKTRLLEELAGRARWRSMRVLWGRCYEYERVLPYQPFAEALRNGMEGRASMAVGGEIRAASLSDSARSASDAAALSALPPIWQKALLLLLPDWADRLHPGHDVLALRPGEEQSQLLEAISQLLSALAHRHPLVLVIDDLHWAAESTLQLFHHLARGVSRQPILLVGSFRPEDLAPATAVGAAVVPPLLRMARSLQAENVLDMVELAPFDRAQVVELVEHLAGTDPTADRSVAGTPRDDRLIALAGGLHRYTEGNPLFVLAAIESLRDTGMIRELLPDSSGDLSVLAPSNGDAAGLDRRIAVDPSDQALVLPLPPRIRSLLQERLDRVPTSAREVARLAAVAGREFDLAVLERAWGKGEEETLLAVDALLAARFFQEGGTRGARDLTFTHHLLKEAIYDALPKAMRTRHHRRIAAAMEAAYGPRVLASELALHYARGEEPLQAVRYGRMAGDQAAASYANDDAVRYYSAALIVLAQARDMAPLAERAGLDLQRIELLDARLALYRRLGRPREEEADVEAMLAAARTAGDKKGEALSLIDRSSLECRSAGAQRALATAREAVALVRNLPAAGYPNDVCTDLDASAQTCIGRASLIRDAYAEALSAYEHALAGYRLLKQMPGREPYARSREALTLYNIGWAHELQGNYAEARGKYEEALTAYRVLGDRLGEANSLVYLGNICWFVNDLPGAQTRYESALALYTQIIYRRGEATCLRNLGLTLWRRGRLEDALGYHSRALALHEALEDPAGVAECHQSIGDIHYLTGRYADALHCYERALALTRDAGSSHGEAQSLFGCARVERARGQPDRALAHIAAARPLCVAIGYRRGLAWCDREAGLARIDLGDAEAACTLLRAALDGFSALGEPSMRIATEADLARAELALGGVDAALQLARDAASALAASDHGVDQPQAVLLTLSQALEAAGDPRGARSELATAAAEVEAQAARLLDAGLRASFLENVPVNRTIMGRALEVTAS